MTLTQPRPFPSLWAGARAHFVTDRRRFGLTIDDLVIRAARAVASGVEVIQVREPDLPDAALVALVRRMAAEAAGSPTRVVVNDRPDVAIAAGAGGIHLRADSPPASRIRPMLADGWLVGRSVHSLADVETAAADGGCDYLLFGTVFPSAGKPDGHCAAGLDALAAVCRQSPFPVLAIGGVTGAQRIHNVIAAGAAGFASVGMFM